MSTKNLGSGIDDFLKEEGIFEATQTQAVKEVAAWQLAETKKGKKSATSKTLDSGSPQARRPE